MPNQQERAELHKTIWKIANDLRGSVDGWEFKAYVLGSIFYRFISENICDYIHQLMKEAGQPNFDYTTIATEESSDGDIWVLRAYIKGDVLSEQAEDMERTCCAHRSSYHGTVLRRYYGIC